jgi:hypothetical protein
MTIPFTGTIWFDGTLVTKTVSGTFVGYYNGQLTQGITDVTDSYTAPLI